ncbi:MAG TPA: cation:proton antiporter [Vicinamibacterales bacterium]|nr:cation:proton antiporter [Vicinamibacterales bacterium]
MPEHGLLLPELVLTYAIALAFILVLARVRVPPIVAFIFAGAFAGPAGIGIVRTQEEVNTLADLGIVLLLFTVGLEFSLNEIQRIWRAVVFGGTLQITATAAALMLLLLLTMHQPWRVSLFIGLFVALSSTAIVLRELSARNQLDAPHGKLMVGVLLFQDLAIVALLLLVPILSGKTALSAVPTVLLRAAAAIGAVAVVSRLVLPVLFRLVAQSGRREAFPLAVLLASIGTAWVSSLLGISMALGAFLGGLILAEGEFSHQAHAEIRPLRDILAGLFFISLGMLANFNTILSQLPMIVAVTTLLVVVKAIVASGSLWIVSTPVRVAVTAGIGLAQVGEFSFILGRSGLDVGLVSPGEWQILLAASIATMVITPALVAVAPRVGSWVAEKTRAAAQIAHADSDALTDHVVILGFGVGGRLLGAALRQLAVPYIILDMNGATVRQMRAAGESIFFGDATNEDALRGAGVERARAVVAVLSDPYASLRAVTAIRSLNPTVPIIVRTRYRGEAEAIQRLGATVAVAEELEASLEVMAQTFARLEVPGNMIEILLDSFRRESTGIRTVRAPSRPLDALPSAISKTPVATHQLQSGDWAVGKTLAEVNLRAETGALVIAVRQNGRHVTSPSADLQLALGDVLYLVGDESDILLARRHLAGAAS